MQSGREDFAVKIRRDETGELNMNKASLAVVISLVMAFAPVVSGASPAAIGQVTAMGSAQINGLAIQSGGTLFAGDRVNTSEGSVATLALSGGNRVVLPASSSVVMQQSDGRIVLQLESGSLAVLSQSSAPVAIEVQGTRVLPVANRAAVLEIAVQGRLLKVLARRGSAKVITAKETVEVPAGKELDATMAPPSPRSPAGAGSSFTGQTLLTAVGLASGLTGLGLGVAAITRSNPSDCSAVSTSGTITCP
jgi:hypothetical protein